MSNSVQARHFVGHDRSPNCLQRLSAIGNSRLWLLASKTWPHDFQIFTETILYAISVRFQNFCLFGFILYIPVNNISVMLGWSSMGWTSAKQWIKHLAQGHNTVSARVEPQTSNPPILSLTLYQLSHCTPHRISSFLFGFKHAILKSQLICVAPIWILTNESSPKRYMINIILFIMSYLI